MSRPTTFHSPGPNPGHAFRNDGMATLAFNFKEFPPFTGIGKSELGVNQGGFWQNDTVRDQVVCDVTMFVNDGEVDGGRNYNVWSTGSPVLRIHICARFDQCLYTA